MTAKAYSFAIFQPFCPGITIGPVASYVGPLMDWTGTNNVSGIFNTDKTSLLLTWRMQAFDATKNPARPFKLLRTS